jgi:hypothetical protein
VGRQPDRREQSEYIAGEIIEETEFSAEDVPQIKIIPITIPRK